MDYTTFRQQYGDIDRDIARQAYQANQDIIQVKKEKTAVINLDRIFTAVFSFSYKKGFQAMSMRDLSREAGISLGALYAYFPGKEKLLKIIQAQGQLIITTHLGKLINTHDHPVEKLRTAIKTHLFLSEMFRPWFYFIFMESRNIPAEEWKAVKSMEDATQKVLIDILDQGEQRGQIVPNDHRMTACMIKAMQQDWYLKRWKYKELDVTVDQYAAHLISIVESFCLGKGKDHDSH